MYAISAIPIFTSTATTRDRLVIAEAFDVFLSFDVAPETKCEVVAVPLASGAGLEGFEDYVCYALAG